MGERFRLHPERLHEILEASGGFSCHKTVNYGDGTEEPDTTDAVECAGRMAVLLREECPDQMMRITMRLGILDPRTIDPDREAYGSIDEVMKAHSTHP